MNSVLAMTQSANSIVFSDPKSGNVLALLNTLYTSGFASHSPSHPLLSGRTMHTLYAISFIVYCLSDICDWIFVYFTLRGYITSFPLKTWIVILIVAIAVIGSMLTSLLFVLCVENAFAHRLDITPYRSGLTVIIESFVQWIQAFNNFRIAFLYMLLHDLPLTILNFFFITACRCAGPQVRQWPLVMTITSTIISILWRTVMLYFAYRRMICPVKSTSTAISVASYPTAIQHLKSNLTQKDGGRMKEYDECWPIRFSVRKIYGTGTDSDDSDNDADNDNDSDNRNDHKGPSNQSVRHKRPRGLVMCIICTTLRKMLKIICALLRLIVCILLTLLIYLISIMALCAPCCYHYGCKSNSFYHRHKWARSFVRYFSQTFHCTMFCFSTLTVLAIFLLNMTLLSSIHAIGSSQIPFEISHVCVAVNTRNRQITAKVDSKSREESSNSTMKYVCKPFWEDGGLGLGLHRQEAGPWQTRIKLSGRNILAISTQIRMNYTDRQNPHHQLLYDYAVLRRYTPGSEEELLAKYVCVKGADSGWTFKESVDTLKWPYYVACDRGWSVKSEDLIECDDDSDRDSGHNEDDIVFF